MSGSAVIAAWTSSSVILRRRFQSVAGSVFEVLPEVSSFMGFGPPGRYNVPLVGIAIGKNHRDLDAIHNPDGVDPYLSVLEAIIRPLYGWPIEYPRSVLKRNAVST